MTTLKRRTVISSLWTVFSQASSQILRLISNLIMTRLLMPEMFGLMAIAQMLYFGLSLLSDVGLQQNLIQSKRSDDVRFVNSIWTAQIIRGIVVWCLGILTAVIVFFLAYFNVFPSQSVYADNQLPWLIVGSTANAFLTGFNSTRIAEKSRQLSLGRASFIPIISQFAGILVMILWAKLSPTVWALVVGSLIASSVNVLLSHTLIDGTPNHFLFDRNELREIYHFGKWMLLTSLMGFLANNADKIVLGALVDSTTLGVYSIAFLLMNSIKELLTRLIGSVVFPAMSEVYRNRPNDAKAIYYRFRQKFDILCFFLVGLLWALAPIIVNILYDQRYKQAGVMLSILAISLLDVRYYIADQCYIAQGKPKWLTPLIGLHVIAVFMLTPWFYSVWGISGAVWAIAISGFARVPVVYYLKRRSGLLDFSKEFIYVPSIIVGYFVGYCVEMGIVNFL